MKVRINLGRLHFFTSLAWYLKVTGVNSKLPGGEHFLMWDFDDTPLEDIEKTLRSKQKLFLLSAIYIVCTGLPRHYHAYCFTTLTWAQVLYILADTEGIDRMFFRIGVMRGYFTLRYTPKKGRELTLVRILDSPTAEDVNPAIIKNFIEYETKRR